MIPVPVLLALIVFVSMIAGCTWYLVVSCRQVRQETKRELRERLQWAAFIGDFTTDEVTTIATISELYEVSR